MSLGSIAATSQSIKMPLQINTEFAMPYTQLNTGIFGTQALNTSKQLGAGISFPLSKHLAIGLEGQYRQYSLKNAIEQRYQGIESLDQNSFKSFEDSKLMNGLASLKWYSYNKKGNNLFEIGMGGGIQSLNEGRNLITFKNDLRLGKTDTLFSQGGKVSGILGQLTLQNTFFISPKIGIRLGVKAQFAPVMGQLTYLKTTGSPMTYQQLCTTTTITQTAANPISFIPSVGITIQLGGGKKPKIPVVAAAPAIIAATTKPQQDKNEKNQNGQCFELRPQTKIERDKCFGDDAFICNILHAPQMGGATVLRYEVYIAPFNDLTNKQLVQTLTLAGVFSISASLFDTNKQYVVMVQSFCRDKQYNCLQYIRPIIRCPNACLDISLPEIKVKE